MAEKEEQAPINFMIEKSLHQKAKELARARGISMAGLIRGLIIKELKQEGKE